MGSVAGHSYSIQNETTAMTIYDIFNGDADGICALVQLRCAQPKSTQLVTGVKRDIKLLDRVEPQAGDELNVLDISMDKNKSDLLRVLDAGACVFYCDHHVAGDIPAHNNLTALINTKPDICTSLLVNGHVQNAFAGWAVVGAFGDNLNRSAEALAQSIGLHADATQKLADLGVYINYNGYGSNLDDLHFHPAQLYQRVSRFKDPLHFIQQDSATFDRLETGYHEDMAQARNATLLRETGSAAAFLLPDDKWARRVSGVYGNALANESPQRAHAVLTERPDGTYLVSVRAPLQNKTAADELCMEFPTGGGRKAAAGINALPADMLDHFLDRLDAIYRNA